MKDSNPPLTEKQMSLLKFLHEFRSRFGESPTLAIMVKNQHLASNRSVIDMIRSLVDKGYLEPSTRVSRSTKLTPKAFIKLSLIDGPKRYEDMIFPAERYLRPRLANAQASDSKAWTKSYRMQGISQQRGTQLDTNIEEFFQIVSNTASLLARVGTSYEVDGIRNQRIHPLYFFLVCCTMIVMIFGSGLTAAMLFIAVVLIITGRIIK